ncbi:gluconate:H+ symporter [Heyndrickxia ginsengihumi]|uniref:Gluconate permease n=1 Tax=Heyndrickxia ginsengihumi TaxID=363870 RepID=A0A0A6VEZ0_9BACI|nr:gluconate:H+ symporter [Heyndrickxia ginsengihumi]KHD86795.1 gluconate permease [Heyndrickxia ginsengihumi]MBE6183314.1 gluconate permease [Bacillus sp. (in: firmicutes)]MCM3022271.1 gluconate:H+ symporter [Heyndrickxia ginsengihumi]NEY18505.1 gluconate permease [Heyndrickxia ginsengihumi]
MPILIVGIGVIILLILIMKFKLNTFISLIVVSFGVAIALGMPLNKIVTSIEGGIGGTIGHLSLVFGLGAMLGKLLADAGGAYRIATTLINRFGEKYIQFAVIIASFIIGIALFFEVGLVLLIPIVCAIAKELRVPILYLGIPMTVALSVTHGFLPPHPGPTALAVAYHANVGQVLILGFIVSIPAVILAGPVFTKFAKRMVPASFNRVGNIAALGPQKQFKLEDTPGFAISTFTAMFPVILMAIATVFSLFVKSDSTTKEVIELIGAPSTAMLLSILLATYTMGIARNIPMKDIMNSNAQAAASIAMMLLIIGGGGAFKQVLIDGGVGNFVADLFKHSSLSPLFLAWCIAAILRLCLGSSTVAALTAAGLAAPLMAASHVNPALMVLATGAGSLIASHVNDAGFWMFKEYFNLSIKETFLTWTLLETVISITGLIVVLLLGSVI